MAAHLRHYILIHVFAAVAEALNSYSYFGCLTAAADPRENSVDSTNAGPIAC